MTGVRVVAFRDAAGNRHIGVVGDDGHVADLGVGELHESIARARAAGSSVAGLLVAERARRRAGGESDEVGTLDEGAAAIVDGRRMLALDVPIAAPETWAAGVTYLRSRDARQAETAESTRDIYARVYDAERPELFLKDAGGRRTVPSGGVIRVRSDSHWTVPEPELAIVLDATGAIVGYTVANDVSARDIEGANPLYLPQAKIYRGSCALGPAVLLIEQPPGAFRIALRILAGRGEIFAATTSTKRMIRPLGALVAALVRDNVIGDGTVLSTGTGIVPPDDVTLVPGLRVEIRIEGIGLLWNVVGANEG